MVGVLLSAQVLALVQGICTTGSTRTCRLSGCGDAYQVCPRIAAGGSCACLA